MEAGDEFSNTKVFEILEGGSIQSTTDEFDVYAEDLIDDDDILSNAITFTITDITDLNNKIILETNATDFNELKTGYDQVNHIFEIEYNVKDSSGAVADPVLRYVIVKDTTAPIIYPSQVDDADISDSFELDYLDPKVATIDLIKSHLLTGLVAKDYGAKGAGNVEVIDGNLSHDATNPDGDLKWDVILSKPDDPSGSFVPSKIYPYDKNNEEGIIGYDVLVTVTDEFGNKSTSRPRTLTVSDKRSPTIELIGMSEIHDFFVLRRMIA